MSSLKYNPKYIPDRYELELIETMRRNISTWDDETAYVTDKIQFRMRNVIKQARKYFFGVYDKPNDEVTGEPKVWVPLTEWTVETVVKSIDLDTKDILIQPGNPSAIGVTNLIRAMLMNQLKRMDFGQLLNDLLRVVARDGTVLIKTFEYIDPKSGKKSVKCKIVDLLNIWIDPNADSVQDTSAIIERNIMSEYDVNAYKDVWDNFESIDYSNSVPKLFNTYNIDRGTIPYTEIWEMHGQIRKSWVTKKASDQDVWVEGHVVASGVGRPKVIHIVRENPRKDGRRPYEECWYKRVDNRWFGRGIAEMLFGLQEYANMTVNIRKANSMVLQNGIFLIRKGSGLSPEMVSSISAGGGLPVTDVARDVKQLQVQDFRQSSYTDEDRVYVLADRVTGALDSVRGELGRASASATANLNADKHIRDTFVLIQEGVGFFVERLLLKQIIPAMKGLMKEDDVIRITGDPQLISSIDQAIIDLRTNKFINEQIDNTGFYPEQDEIDTFQKKEQSNLKRMGKHRFITYFRGMFDENIDIEVQITDEKFNKVVAVQQLRDMLIAYSRLPVASRLNTDAILGEIINLMGLRGEFFLEKPEIPALLRKGGGASQAGRLLKSLPSGVPTQQTAFENANKIPQTGAPVGQQSMGVQGGGRSGGLDERLNVNTNLSPINF